MMRVSVLLLVMCGAFALFALFACGLSACGSDEVALGGFNALCNQNSDCDEGQALVCVGADVNEGICSSACMADGDCVVHGGETKCVGAGISNGYCYQTCVDSVTCPRDHTCFMTPIETFGTCRAEN